MDLDSRLDAERLNGKAHLIQIGHASWTDRQVLLDSLWKPRSLRHMHTPNERAIGKPASICFAAEVKTTDGVVATLNDFAATKS